MTDAPIDEAAAAVDKVVEAFATAHRTADRLMTDTAWLLQQFLKACRVTGVHPNDSSITSSNLGEAVSRASEAAQMLSMAHRASTLIRDELIARGVIPPVIEPKDGGGGKKWP